VNVDDMIILSIDDHTIEPPDLFEGRMPAKYVDRAPRLTRDSDGFDHWVFDGKSVATVGLNATVSWPKEEWGLNPGSMAEMRPGAYRIDERVRDMDRNGILASMCFPSMVGFSGGRLQDNPDKDLSLAVLPTWSPDEMVTEVRRVAAMGVRAVTMPELPHLLGLPTYQSDYWDPIWKVAIEENVVVCLHIGQGLDAINMGPDFSPDNYMVLATQVSVLSVQDLLWGPVMRKFPELRFAFSEGGIGWIPFMLDRVDRHYDNQKWTGQDFGGKRPSEVFREHSLACFISDPTSLKLAHDIGIDNIAFEVDYPHSDSVWPNAPEFLLEQCEGAGLTDAEINKITWENAARFCSYDPFAVIPKEKATVSALRALSPDVDIEVRSRAEFRALYDANPPYEVARV